MRPLRILFFMISVSLMVCLLLFFFPKGGFKLSNNYTIKFASYTDFLKEKESQYTDISGILSQYKLLNDSIALLIKKDSIVTKKDSVKKDSKNIFHISFKAVKIAAKTEFKVDSIKLAIQKIEFAENHIQSLYSFFKGVNEINNNSTPIHVLHYGDSQIEGDRISSIIRNRLQFYFGGSGVGLVPAVVDNFNSMSIRHSSSANWNIFKSFGPSQKYAGHKRYGALLNFSKYNLSNYTDSTKTQGWITLKKSSISYESVKKYKQCRIFCGYNSKPVSVELYQKDQLLQEGKILPNKILNVLKFKFDVSPDELTFKFKGFDSPDFYGISFEDEHGIEVDNIPLRGSSGLEFTKTDLPFLKAMYAELNVKMLILQFGVNVVPNVTTNYDYYENALYYQLVTLKNICPDMSIVVIGLSDMSRKENGVFVSYPNIELIRDAQKNAAFKAGCAFWDMYKAMGGKNSMPGWVFAKPSLARTDFTHFTPQGAKIIADMFYNALVLEYLDYMKKESVNSQAVISK